MKQLTKKILVSLLFAGTTIYADVPTAHTNTKAETALNTMLQSYKKVVLSNDRIKTLDFTYPKVFSVTPKAQLIQLIKQEKNNISAPKIKVTNIIQRPVFPIKKYAKGLYTLVNYEMDTKVDFARPDKKEMMNKMLKNPKKLASMQNILKTMYLNLSKIDGTLKFEKNSFLANVHSKGSGIVINEENKGWKILKLSSRSVLLLEKILPKEIYNTYRTQINRLQSKNKM